MYQHDDEYSLIYENFSKDACRWFFIHDEFLFPGKNLCIPKGSLQKLLIQEAYEGGLMENFGVNKTLEIFKEHFY